MIKQEFQTVPYSYRKGGSQPSGQIAPWSQTNWFLMGMFTIPYPDPSEEQTPFDQTSGSTTVPEVSLDQLYLLVALYDAAQLGGEGIGQYLFDASTGVSNAQNTLSQGAIFLGNFITSATGVLYLNFTGAGTAGLYITDPTTMLSQASPAYTASTFGKYQFTSTVQVDESAGVLLDITQGSNNGDVSAYSLTTGALSYTIHMPDNVIAMCMLGDGLHAYALCQNGVLVLFDYTTGAVLNVFRVMPASGLRWPNYNGATPTVLMYFYPTYSQLFIVQLTPNASDGSNTTVVNGYKMVDTPNRLTPPIPLQSPIAGKTIQVLSQILSDLNTGMGGAIVFPSVSGAAQSGIASTDAKGRCFAKVVCSSTGSVAINCNVAIPDVI